MGIANTNILAKKDRLNSEMAGHELSSGAADTRSESGIIDNHVRLVVAGEEKSSDTIEGEP